MLVILIISLSIIVTVTLMLIFNYKLRIKYRTLRYQQKLLRSQMNPHFIFNALSAINVYVLENDIETSSKFLSDFSKLMRQVLRSSDSDYISLKEEIEILTYYLNIQRKRFVPSFNFIINVDDKISIDKTFVPPMIMQPFLENAVEHGIKDLGHEGIISILIQKRDKHLIMEIDDNGVGINSLYNKLNLNNNHESMAISITKKRLDVIRHDKKTKTGLEIIDKKDINPFERGTKVIITLPIVELNNSKQKQNGKESINS